MSDAERILAYVDEQLAGMRRAPLMWGPPIAIEMQYLQLLETRLLVLRPDLDREQPRLVLDKYAEFLRKKYPKVGNGSLANLFDDASAGELVAALHDFENALADLVAPPRSVRAPRGRAVHRVTRTEHDAMAIARAIYDVPEERRLDALAFALRMAIEGGWLERVSPPVPPASSPACETTASETRSASESSASCESSTSERPRGGGSRGSGGSRTEAREGEEGT